MMKTNDRAVDGWARELTLDELELVGGGNDGAVCGDVGDGVTACIGADGSVSVSDGTQSATMSMTQNGDTFSATVATSDGVTVSCSVSFAEGISFGCSIVGNEASGAAGSGYVGYGWSNDFLGAGA